MALPAAGAHPVVYFTSLNYPGEDHFLWLTPGGVSHSLAIENFSTYPIPHCIEVSFGILFFRMTKGFIKLVHSPGFTQKEYVVAAREETNDYVFVAHFRKLFPVNSGAFFGVNYFVEFPKAKQYRAIDFGER